MKNKKPTKAELEVIMELTILALEKLGRAYKHFTIGRKLNEEEKRIARKIFEAIDKTADIDFTTYTKSK